jgi:16S rRNA processing protein RimM
MTALPEPAPDDWVSLARIRRPQGRKGEVFADLLTDFPEKFASRRRLWLIPDGAPGPGSPRTGLRPWGGDPSHSEIGDKQNPTREVELIHHWPHKGGIVLHFAGVDSISAAEALTGLYVAIPLAERTPLADNEAYIGDLVGCMLVDLAGAAPQNVGIIEEVDRTAGPAPLLTIRGARGEILVPFAQAYLRKIDVTAKRVEMVLPEGLIDLNTSSESTR